VTTPLRTLLDIANSPISPEHLSGAVRDALERGLVRRRLLETAPCSPEARRRLDRALAVVLRAAEWNSPPETEKAPSGPDLAPEGAFQLQPGISNPWLSQPKHREPPNGIRRLKLKGPLRAWFSA